MIHHPQVGHSPNISTAEFDAQSVPYGVERSGHQQWDEHGKAVGYSGDPRLYRSQPQREPGLIPTYRTEGGSGYDSQGHSVDWDMDAHQQSGMRIHIPKVDASPPKIVSPLGLHSPLDLQNPFDESAPTTTHQASHSPPIPLPTAPMTAPITTPPRAVSPSQTAASQPPAISTSLASLPFPNPYDANDATPTRFNHPYFPSLNSLFYDQEATDDSFFTAGGHSREIASAPFAPTPQFPNPYGAHVATPTQFNHPRFPSPNTFLHDRETTDDSFFMADGYSRENASTLAPPPRVPPRSQTAAYQPRPPTISKSITFPPFPPFPSPYGAHDATPEFNHSYSPPSNNLFYDQEATGDSFFTADGHSRENAYAPFKPPQTPPNYS